LQVLHNKFTNSLSQVTRAVEACWAHNLLRLCRNVHRDSR